jgi:hypothetical protein
MQIYNSFSGCRAVVLSVGDGLLTHLPYVSRPNNNKPFYEATQNLIINTWSNLDNNKKPLKA